MPKPLLLETIRIEEGEVHNLSYHQTRCDRSRQILFGKTSPLLLASLITPPSKGLYRCRILYDTQIQSIEYLPYTPKKIKKLKVVPSTIQYPYKYADRKPLKQLLHQYPNSDEIIIEQEGYITDTTIANIALYNGTTWYTPQKPLLQGTMRQKLLDQGKIHPRPIKKEEIQNYTQIALLNAMLGFYILDINLSSIKY